jgi:two-component system response regulator PilR (NtrC family)
VTVPRGTPRILVIDDEPDLRDTLDALLSSVGYDVVTVASGRAAVERAGVEAFDLAITDLRMPGLSGVDTVAALRRTSPGLTVIVVSGYVSDESATRCMDEGVAQILPKPFDIDDLLRAVEVALQERAF